MIHSREEILLPEVLVREQVYCNEDYARGPLSRERSCSSFFLNRSTTTLSDPIIWMRSSFSFSSLWILARYADEGTPLSSTSFLSHDRIVSTVTPNSVAASPIFLHSSFTWRSMVAFISGGILWNLGHIGTNIMKYEKLEMKVFYEILFFEQKLFKISKNDRKIGHRPFEFVCPILSGLVSLLLYHTLSTIGSISDHGIILSISSRNCSLRVIFPPVVSERKLQWNDIGWKARK